MFVCVFSSKTRSATQIELQNEIETKNRRISKVNQSPLQLKMRRSKFNIKLFTFLVYLVCFVSVEAFFVYTDSGTCLSHLQYDALFPLCFEPGVDVKFRFFYKKKYIFCKIL